MTAIERWIVFLGVIVLAALIALTVLAIMGMR